MKRWKIHDSILLSMWSGMEKWRNEDDIIECPELPVIDDSMNIVLSDTIKAAYKN